MDMPREMGIIVSGTRRLGREFRDTTLVEGDCLILFIPSLGNTASSLFRPRRNILVVFDGVFLLGSSTDGKSHAGAQSSQKYTPSRDTQRFDDRLRFS
jgi:hypothetical protein